MLALLFPLLFATYTPDQLDEARRKIWEDAPEEVKVAFFPKEDSGVRGTGGLVRLFRSRTPEVKRKFVEWEKRMAYPMPGYIDHLWEEEIFYHGDEEMVRKFVKKTFEEGDMDNYGQKLSLSQNPDVVGLMGPYLFAEDRIPNSVNESLTKQVATQVCFRELLPACVEFPAEVRLWARRQEAQGTPLETSIAIMQKWWKENEAAFKSREYDKVKPGVLSIPGMKKSVMLNPPDFDEAGSATTPMAIGSSALPNPTAAPLASTPVAAPAESPSPSATFLWTGAVVTLALLVSLLVFWKRRT